MKIRKGLKSQAGISVSSMSDITFLLLIFFMLSSFAEVDKEIPITLPESRVSLPVKEQFFNVWIDETGTLYYDNEEGTISGLSVYSTYRLSMNPELVTLIRAEKNVEYSTIDKVLQALKKGGIQNVLFVSEKREE